MTAGAPVRVHDLSNPLALASDVRRDPVAGGTGAWKIVLRRHLQQREPVLRRIVLRGCAHIRRRNGFQVDELAWRRLCFRRVDQPVSADPDVVLRGRKIRHEIAAAIVGHDALDEMCRRVPRFGNDPDAGFRTLRAADNAADVVFVDGDAAAGLSRLSHDDRAGPSGQQCADAQRQRDGDSLLRAHASPSHIVFTGGRLGTRHSF